VAPLPGSTHTPLSAPEEARVKLIGAGLDLLVLGELAQPHDQLGLPRGIRRAGSAPCA
jgi:hypothetical protein